MRSVLELKSIDRLLELVRLRGTTQLAISQKAGYKRDVVSDIQSGITALSSRVKQLAKALEIDPSVIMNVNEPLPKNIDRFDGSLKKQLFYDLKCHKLLKQSGERLREIRIAAYLEREELAKKAELDPSKLADFEEGFNTFLSDEEASSLTEALGHKSIQTIFDPREPFPTVVRSEKSRAKTFVFMIKNSPQAPELRKSFGKRLRHAREWRSLTLEQLSEKSEINRMKLKRLEKGDSLITETEIHNLVKSLTCSIPQ